MAVISNKSVYDYYLATYGGQSEYRERSNRFDSHKKSELCSLYNNILKTNKNSPIFKINMDGDEVTKFAIDLKENARHTQNVVSALSTEGDDIESVFYKKVAVSSNEDAVGVTYVGKEKAQESPSFDLGVQKIATPQINTGKFLPQTGHDFEEGSYSFDLDTNSKSFEFQFNVNYGDNNYDVVQRVARLINTSDVGISARVLMNNRNRTTALEVTSKQTGLAEDEDYLFKISSSSSWRELNTLGIDKVSQEPENSAFTLNGSSHSSLSNTFTINQAFEITLKGTTPDDKPAHIGFKANTDAIADSVDELLTSFNGFIAVGQKYESGKGHNQLLNELNALSNTFGDALASVGIQKAEDGTLYLDRTTIADSVTGEDAKKAFNILNRFKDSLSREAEKTSINPMNYVDKVTVEYKNPKRNFLAPYASSVYSGLLVDQAL
ncbi:MAG: flagellar capping protein [Lachnospiraceae bacterium]|nr:flagellar capping protein [Lachnospiraceae bacterium]